MNTTTAADTAISAASDSSSFRRSQINPRLQAERLKKEVNSAVKELIRQFKHSNASEERRRQGRFEFLQTIKVRLENDREFTVLSRDLSVDGIRMVGTSSLLGQKIQVIIPRPNQPEPLKLRARILWTCAVADGLFENGGNFLELVEG
jgi:hypothetical protein